MKRILILGCCGSGKSTLARSLSDITGLDIIHLDKEYWNPGWIETPKIEWEEKIRKLVQKDGWIMDGNYSSSLDIRIPRADTIIYLDRSTITCLTRVIKRIWNHRGKTRPDMTEGCNERFDLKFLHYVTIFNLTYRKKVFNTIQKTITSQKVHIFNNDLSTHDFLKSAKSKL